MRRELELWQFIASRLNRNVPVMLLVVAGSSGSSPGRAGYKMAVGSDGELSGSIGGGVMEVRLVEQSRLALDAEARRHGDAAMSEPVAAATGFRTAALIEQAHKKNASNASGLICSGRQTVLIHLLSKTDSVNIDVIIQAIQKRARVFLTITPTQFSVVPLEYGTQTEDFNFIKLSDAGFSYKEKIGPKNDLYIVGGGHCALALSELMSKMDFRISIFDDRPALNTIEKNRFADEITIIESYEQIGELIPSGPNIYVVVMTVGYKHDAVVIRALLDKDFKYFGVLGSKAKMKTLVKTLEKDGFAKERLSHIRTPIGLPINSRTPEEIAISIAAEVIAVKNAAM